MLTQTQTNQTITGQTLEALAASFNYYPVDKIPAKFYECSEFATDTPWRLELIKKNTSFDLSKLAGIIPGLEFGQFVEVQSSTDVHGNHRYFFIDQGKAVNFVKFPGDDFFSIVQEDWKTKKICFFLAWPFTNKYSCIYYDIRNRAAATIKEPNKIGTFTASKLLAWRDYVREYREALESLLKATNDKNKAIEQEIKSFISALGPSANISEWGKEVKYTRVRTPLFDVNFTHYKDQSYLNKKIEFLGGLDDIVKIESK